MVELDLIDKRILYALGEDARLSYRMLARKLDLSVTAVRNRVLRLEEGGIILRYLLYPSYAMLDASFFLAFLHITRPPPRKAFCDLLGSNPMIDNVNTLADGNVLCWGKYVGSRGLDELSLWFHNLTLVKDVEFHTLLVERGKKCALNSMQVQVLRYLREDVRMPIGELAKRTGLTHRRVRKILDTLLGSSGSAPEDWFHESGVGDFRTSQQCFHARADGDVAEGGSTRFLAKVVFRGGDEQRREIVKTLKHAYPHEYWFTIASASAPVLFIMFLVAVANETPQILSRIKDLKGVDSVKPIVHYAHTFYPGLYDAYWTQLFATT